MTPDITLNFREDSNGYTTSIVLDEVIPPTKGNKRLLVEIEGEGTFKYTLLYYDAGTVGYASMQGRQAINGHMTNVDIDWANKDRPYYSMIHLIGSINHRENTMSLLLSADKN